MKGKTVKESRAQMTHLVLPIHANMRGTAFGGAILSLADSVAYICAARHAGPNCVTVGVDRVSFLEPIAVGEVVTLLASVNYVGATSMEVGIRIEAENLKNGKRRHTTSCYFTLVCLDERSRPKKVPPLVCQTPDDKRRFKEAKKRREGRTE